MIYDTLDGILKSRHARVPVEVTYDDRLSYFSRVVYTAIAGCVFEGKIADVSQRKLAADLKTTQSRVSKAVKELVSCGHLEVFAGHGRRVNYRLMSDVFKVKPLAEPHEPDPFTNRKVVKKWHESKVDDGSAA